MNQEVRIYQSNMGWLNKQAVSKSVKISRSEREEKGDAKTMR